MAAHGALAHIEPSDIIQRIANGEYAAHIAKSLGVSKVSLHHKLRAHPDYKPAREVGCEVRLDDCLAEFDDIDTSSQHAVANLARARERFKAVAWHAEREFPERWGNKTTVTHDVSSGLLNRLADARSRLIDVSSVQQVIENGADDNHSRVSSAQQTPEDAQVIDSK